MKHTSDLTLNHEAQYFYSVIYYKPDIKYLQQMWVFYRYKIPKVDNKLKMIQQMLCLNNFANYSLSVIPYSSFFTGACSLQSRGLHYNSTRVTNWTITRAYRRQSKKPNKRGSMYILIVFLFSPPSLLISICLFFDMNTLTLYFYQPTTSRRWGTIHVIDLHPPARFLIAAADRRSACSCSRNTPHGSPSSICWTDRQKKINKIKKNRSDILLWKKKKLRICL